MRLWSHLLLDQALLASRYLYHSRNMPEPPGAELCCPGSATAFPCTAHVASALFLKLKGLRWPDSFTGKLLSSCNLLRRAFLAGTCGGRMAFKNSAPAMAAACHAGSKVLASTKACTDLCLLGALAFA